MVVVVGLASTARIHEVRGDAVKELAHAERADADDDQVGFNGATANC